MGAAACGQTIKLSVKAPEDCGELYLCVGEESFPMERKGQRFEISWTAPMEPAVLRYHFMLPGGTCFGPQGLRAPYAGGWQLTVYDASFTTPKWYEGKTMYQIFPDRFNRGRKNPLRGIKRHREAGREIEYHEDWDEPVKWQGRDGKDYCPNDFYGGSLAGIREKLDYLKDMGVDIIYLNPIFEADSNHRYNTGDYKKIDPILGNLADFKALCADMKERDMRLVLDGVFSHTGDDSIYFNKYGRYEGPGAYQSPESPYASWFDFESYPDKYRCWWNFKTLPEVNENDPAWQEAIVSGRHSVVKTWLRRGADGWRLDVADELPDEVLELIRAQAKAEDPEAFILGEVWEDATTKQSYGKTRTYALGRALDSVMNYPLRTALTDFVLGKADAGETVNFLKGQKLNYPAPMYRCLMNLLGSHDTPRIRTLLALGHDGGAMDRSQQAAAEMSEGQNLRGKALQRLCAAAVFSLPGIPAVYYGDEEGMTGFRDPFCRGTYRLQEEDTRGYYSYLANLRRDNPGLSRGDVAFAAPDPDTLCILRFGEGQSWLTTLSRAWAPKRLSISPKMFSGALRSDIADAFEGADIYMEALSADIRRIK